MSSAYIFVGLTFVGILGFIWAILSDGKEDPEEPFEFSPQDIANVQSANGLQRDSRGRFAKRT